MPKSMLYPIKPGCFRQREDGTSIIHIQYCYTNKNKTLLDTKIVVPIASWDSKKLLVKPDLPAEYGSARKLNEALDVQVRLIEELIKYTEKRGLMKIYSWL
jgi:hypothetical protein